MKLNIVVAVAENGIIGGNNKLLWNLPADMKYFRLLTTNHTVIMGRKTYESIGKPLPNRLNIIISRNIDFKVEGCYTVASLAEAIRLAQEIYANNDTIEDQQLFVIGGAQIYKLAMKKADFLYVTELKAAFEGDTYFENIDKNDWHEVSREIHMVDEKNHIPFDFVVYKKSTN